METGKMYSFTEAAVIADVDSATLRHAVKGGRLQAMKQGRNWVVAETELQRWLNDRHAHKPGPKRKTR